MNLSIVLRQSKHHALNCLVLQTAETRTLKSTFICKIADVGFFNKHYRSLMKMLNMRGARIEF